MSYRAGKPKVFISFDYTNDNRYRNLLNALINNARFTIDFVDNTPGEIQTSDVARVKGVLTTRIRDSTHALIIIGDHINSYHPDRDKIGYRNWQWWEIDQSALEGNRLVAVTLDANMYTLPEVLTRRSYSLVRGFDIAKIEAAIK